MLTALPAFTDNYIWSRDIGSGAILVDPGDAAPVLAAVDAGLRLGAILITHHHPDHIGGLVELRDRYRLPCFGPNDARIPGPITVIGEGDRIRLCGQNIRVMAVPGHTASHIALVSDDVLFCGDTLFSLGCGRLFEGSAAQMHDSLQRLATLPGSTQVCCAHEYTLANAAFASAVEPDNADLRAHIRTVQELRAQGRSTLPSRIDLERACNPFLRVTAPAVRHAVTDRLGRMPDDDIETFATLRAWKDGFRA
ncbi:MAG TPA: hydroxyacylglutathione hydrolase [Xanthomonadales bacterium]|nr:hydroxyacylglutathione hydrolase [Xanthomonadales bacterium]